MKKVLIVLPTYNEEGNIQEVIERIFSQKVKIPEWDLRVLVVDSNSQDQTAKITRKMMKSFPRLYLLETEKEGLGKAYINGFSYGLDKLQPYVMFEMDADLSHNADDIPRFLKEIEKGADYVVGSRYIKGGSIPADWGIHRKILSISANLIIRFGFMKLKNSEWTNGYRAIKSWVIKDAFNHIKNYSGYVFQVAFLDYALTHHVKIAEIPIHFKDRKAGISKINALQYIGNSLLYVFLHSSFIKFVIVGLIGFGIDFGISYLGIEVMRAPVWMATLISTETAIVSNFSLNNFWSFSHKKLDNNLKTILSSFFKFNIVSSVSVLIQTIGMQLLVNTLGGKFWFIYKAAIIFLVIIPYSYVLYNKVVWKEKH